jgi:hypothetical protein
MKKDLVSRLRRPPHAVLANALCSEAADALDAADRKQSELRERAERAEAERDALLKAAKLVIAWYDAVADHSKADFYKRLNMCRESEAACRAAIAKAEGGGND